MEKGMIQIYTGDGKGKTTAAFGLAVRAAGAGLRVYIAQFMKSGIYSEIAALKCFMPQIEVVQYGRKGFVCGQPSDEDRQCARAGFDMVCAVVRNEEYDVVICDELNVAVHCGLIEEAAVLALFDIRPQGMELIVTGRNATEKIMGKADLVTEMKPIKHYYDTGVQARVGIEK